MEDFNLFQAHWCRSQRNIRRIKVDRDLPPLSVLLRAPSLWGQRSHLWGKRGDSRAHCEWKISHCRWNGKSETCWHTHYSCCSFLWLTLPTEPRAGGNLDNAVARWDKHTNKPSDYYFPVCFFLLQTNKNRFLTKWGEYALKEMLKKCFLIII